MDADVFLPFDRKNGSSFFPNHWVALNSAIQIRKYDETTRTLKAPMTINPLLVKTILDSFNAKQEAAEEEADLYGEEATLVEYQERILLNAFSWGNQYTPVFSRIKEQQEAKLKYFLQGFYGYIKAKR